MTAVCTVCTYGHGTPGTPCERHGKLIPTREESELRSYYGSDVCSLSRGHLGKHRCDTREAIENGCHRSPNSDYREKRPCPGCGLVAIRTIFPPGIFGRQESVSHCTACKLEASADNHDYQARKLRAQAAAIRAKRKNRRKA